METKDGIRIQHIYQKGEVVYQHKTHVRIEPVYPGENGEHYIEIDGHLSASPQNPFNGYCYRQDGE